MRSAGTFSLKRNACRAAVLLAGCAVALGVMAGTAFAHITVSATGGQAVQGGTAELTFRVPNEMDNANVTEVQVQVPTAHPIAQFLVKPVPGWNVTVQTVKLTHPITTDDGTFAVAVSEVTWSGGSIPPGYYQDFSVSADPLPSGVGQIVFKALQTYSNGQIVRWIQLPQAGEPAPEYPAPTLTLAPAGTAATTTADSASRPAAQAAAGSDNTPALAVGIAGLVAGLLGLAMGLTAVLRGRRPGTAEGGR
jgi:periplasmic copper chaperone A